MIRTTSGNDIKHIVSGNPRKMNIIAATKTTNWMNTWKSNVKKKIQWQFVCKYGFIGWKRHKMVWFTSRNRHDVNASNANDMAYCLIISFRDTISALSNCRTTINGRIVFSNLEHKQQQHSKEKYLKRTNQEKCKHKQYVLNKYRSWNY